MEERTQAPEVDDSIPAEFNEDDPDEEIVICAYCEYQEDHEDVLICDSCNRYYHMECAGVENVPDGDWFCQPCLLEQRASLNQRDSDRSEIHLRSLPRYRGRRERRSQQRQQQQRGQQQRQNQQSSSWRAVWQSVWHRLGLDFDSEWIDDEQKAMVTRPEIFGRLTRDREVQAWEDRLQVAQQQGGRNSRFLETRGALFAAGPSRQAPSAPSEDEVRAWNDLDKARTLDAAPRGNGRRKRKAPTESPVEPPTQDEPVRKFKRPMTRRAQEFTRPKAEASTSAQTGDVDESNTNHTSPTVNDNRGSTFLQSLLEEVEAAGTNETTVTAEASPAAAHKTFQSKRDASSFALSPTIPARGRAPTAQAPEARRAARSDSPPLTSFVRPNYRNTTNRNADAAPSQPSLVDRQKSRKSLEQSTVPALPHDTKTSSRRDTPRPFHREATRTSHRIPKPAPSSSTNKAQSPPQNQISINAKVDISKMVQVALKPFRHSGRVSDSEYTRINREVSRKMYEIVGYATELDEPTKKKWEKVAAEHVEKAVDSLGKM